MNLKNKENHLEEILKKYKKIVVAFSGGVDSSFLLVKGIETLGRQNVLAVNLISSMQPKREEDYAKNFAEKYKAHIIYLKADEYSIKEFVENSKDRCYFCKHAIFTKIIEESKKKGFNIICDGTNYDDLNDYRPGLRALKELNVKSPLKEAKLSKNEIRELSKKINIETWKKPSAACLASRVPYGTKISPEIMKKVELSEEFLRQLGFINHRVRYHGNIARIEINLEQIKLLLENREKIIKKFKEIGFLYVTMDLSGYTMGSQNLAIGG